MKPLHSVLHSYQWLTERHVPVTAADLASARTVGDDTARHHLQSLRRVGLAEVVGRREGERGHGSMLWVAT